MIEFKCQSIYLKQNIAAGEHYCKRRLEILDFLYLVFPLSQRVLKPLFCYINNTRYTNRRWYFWKQEIKIYVEIFVACCKLRKHMYLYSQVYKQQVSLHKPHNDQKAGESYAALNGLHTVHCNSSNCSQISHEYSFLEIVIKIKSKPAQESMGSGTVTSTLFLGCPLFLGHLYF